MKKRLIGIILIVAMICIGLTACDLTDESNREAAYTEEIQSQISDAIGKPNISNFYEYAQLKEIYEMRDNPELICYWYTKNDYTGKWIYQGECIGYGIPYGSSITSPEQYEYNGATLPLAEPNGLYNNGVSTSATWILAADEDGNTKPTYVESEITVSQVKLDKRLCEEWSIPEDY